MVAAWFDDPNAFGAWSGALLGVLGGFFGILGGITGWLAPKGIGRRVILPLWWASCALGAGLAVFGVAALFSTEPYAIWYPFVLGGGMLVVLGGSLLPLVHRRYGEADERRAAAAELRGGAVPSVRAPGRALPPLLFVGILMTIWGAMGVSQRLGGNPDIWWTPMAMAPTLAKSSDRAVVFVGDDRLERAVEAGKIQRITDTGPVTVRPDEIRVRFNNWDRVRAERLPLLALNAALLGMGVVLLGIGGRNLNRRARAGGSANAQNTD